MKGADTIKRLQALADHPETPPEEADNARRRIAEIKERLAKGRTQVRGPEGRVEVFHSVVAAKQRFGIARLKKERRVDLDAERQERTIKDEWPFGWEGPKAPIEHESMRNPVTGDLVVNWKCPNCGEHVTRVVNARHVLRLSGRPGKVAQYVSRLTDGSMNQLCPACFDTFRGVQHGN